MSFNEKDKEWIKQQVQDLHKKRGLLGIIKEWGALGAVVAILIFMATQWREYLEFRIHTQDKLASIDAMLLELRAPQSPSVVLKEIGGLNKADFARALPALRKVEEKPVTDVKPEASTLHDVADKLRHVDETTVDYWPTVLGFIQFATVSLSPGTPPLGSDVSFFVREGSRSANLTVAGKVIRLEGGQLVDSHFENSRIVFTEKTVNMKNVTFLNCVFELPVTDNPTAYFKQLTRLLLADGLNSVHITSL